MTDLDLVRELEELIARGWPSLHVKHVDGWVLRASRGATRRGNSVWPRGPVADPEAALRVVEEFYDAQVLPPTFQISPAARPAGLGALLDVHGYDDRGPTDVCVADLDDVLGLDDGADLDDGEEEARPAGVELRPEADDRWLTLAGEVFAGFRDHRAASAQVLGLVRLPSAYALMPLDGAPAAVGRAVLDGPWVGIYSMATLPAARRRGAARAVLRALAAWAADRGGGRAYVQVEETSTAARRLYEAAGFAPVYRYTYRRRPFTR
ncbi:MAG TPA: GNAT family N-acetyltransferase [Frankiaceae bacterium]|nr:GNAT family N-acetyltransferase [Frankiaceae bacterium]